MCGDSGNQPFRVWSTVFLVATLVCSVQHTAEAWMIAVPLGTVSRRLGFLSLSPERCSVSLADKSWTRHSAIDLSATAAAASSIASSALERLVNDHGYGTRVVSCNGSALLNGDNGRMLWAEVVVNGETRMARVTAIRRHGGLPTLDVTYCAQNADNSSNCSSLDAVLVNSTIDLGQVTTVWNDNAHQPPLFDSAWPIPMESLVGDQHVEVALDTLYQARIGRVQSGAAAAAAALTKKQIAMAVQAAAAHGSDDLQKQQMETVLRQLCKTGPGYGRLVDSKDLARHLGDAGVWPSKPSLRSTWQGRSQAAGLLAQDSAVGGRFKRWPCLFLHDENDTIVFVNGGWLVTDRSVRAGSEARKFVERGLTATQTAAAGTTTTPMNHSPTTTNNHRCSTSWADARIVRRLECLAMGELTAPSTTVRAAPVTNQAKPKGSSTADHAGDVEGHGASAESRRCQASPGLDGPLVTKCRGPTGSTLVDTATVVGRHSASGSLVRPQLYRLCQ
jgi:hypothetical protein